MADNARSGRRRLLLYCLTPSFLVLGLLAPQQATASVVAVHAAAGSSPCPIRCGQVVPHPASAPRLRTSSNVASGSFQSGDVFVGEGNGLIERYSPSGVLLQTMDTGSGSTYETDMCFDGASELYTTNFSTGTVSKFDNQGNLLSSSWGGTFSTPESCYPDASGHIYVGSVSGPLEELDTSGNVLNTFTSLQREDHVAIEGDGCTVLYTDESSSIHQFNACTSTQEPDFATGLPGPCYQLQIRSDGEVFVACAAAIVQLSQSGSVLQTYSASSLGASFLFTLSLDPDGSSFWTADVNTGLVTKVDIASGNVLDSFTAYAPNGLFGLEVAGGTASGGRQWVPMGPDGFVSSFYGGHTQVQAGRVTALALDPAANVVYAGTPGGGVWRGAGTSFPPTTPTWSPLSDAAPSMSVESLAIDPANPNVMYAGSSPPFGAGILKTTDLKSATPTWSVAGNTGCCFGPVSSIVVDHSAGQHLHVLAATGNGLIESSDGGGSWLPSGPLYGDVTQVVEDPLVPTTFWAAEVSGGTSCQATIYRSTDDGSTWAAIPAPGAKSGPTFSDNTSGPFDPGVGLGVGSVSAGPKGHIYSFLYAAISNCWGHLGALMRINVAPNGTYSISNLAKSSTAPTTASKTLFYGALSQEGNTVGQGNFDNVVAIDPSNPCHALFGGVTLWETLGSFDTGSDACPTNPKFGAVTSDGHEDQHALTFTTDGNWLLVGNDGGVFALQKNAAGTFASPAAPSDLNNGLAITQFYRGQAQSGSFLIGGAQDVGTVGIFAGSSGPSWQAIGGGDGGYSILSVVGDTWAYYEQVGGVYSDATSSGFFTQACGLQGPPVPYPVHCLVSTLNGVVDGGPAQFPDPPLFMDPNNQDHAFLAASRVFEYNGSNYWNDITGKDLTAGNQPGGFSCNPYCPDYISAMDVTADTNTIVTGSAYGRVWRGTHGLFGWSWKDITGSLPQPTGSSKSPGQPWISDVTINPNDANEVWVTIQGLNPDVGGVWHTTDAGDDNPTWTNITGGLAGSLGGIPVTAMTEGGGSIYVATPGAVFACSSCEGSSAQPAWQQLGTGLPSTWITDLSYTGSDLIAWTFGRGAWKLPTS